jgi:1-deoxy-D-xylulose 5-phosphate reductoisomerase
MSENNVTRISVLGSTGSVGEQALDVAANFGYEVCALSSNKNS